MNRELEMRGNKNTKFKQNKTIQRKVERKLWKRKTEAREAG